MSSVFDRGVNFEYTVFMTLLFSHNKITTLFLVAICLSVLVFSIDFMHMDGGLNSLPCPFMGFDVICQITISDHMATFQSIFGSIPGNIFSLVSLLLLAVSVLTLFQLLANSTREKYFGFFADKVNPSIFNKFLLAISDGILQPKLYA